LYLARADDFGFFGCFSRPWLTASSSDTNALRANRLYDANIEATADDCSR
jgi:hypothetical protein